MQIQGVLHGVHAQCNVHSWAVGEEGSQSSLNKHAKDQDSVPVEQRSTSETGQRVKLIKSVQYTRKHLKSYNHKLSTWRWITTKVKLQLELLRNVSPVASFTFLPSLTFTFVPFSSPSLHLMCFLTYFMPCWKREFLLVLQMIRSAHWTTTILAKKAVWQVNSIIFLCS